MTYLKGDHSDKELVSFEQLLLDLLKKPDSHANVFNWKQLRKGNKYLLVKTLFYSSGETIWNTVAFSGDGDVTLTAEAAESNQDGELFGPSYLSHFFSEMKGSNPTTGWVIWVLKQKDQASMPLSNSAAGALSLT